MQSRTTIVRSVSNLLNFRSLHLIAKHGIRQNQGLGPHIVIETCKMVLTTKEITIEIVKIATEFNVSYFKKE